jgi:Tfp pilus assembly protein PilV
MIKALVLLSTVLITTGVYALTNLDMNSASFKLNHSVKKMVAQALQPKATEFSSQGVLFSRNQVRNMKLKQIDLPKYKNKPCSDLDTLFHQCKNKALKNNASLNHAQHSKRIERHVQTSLIQGKIHD